MLFTFHSSLVSCGYHPIGHLSAEPAAVGTIAVPTWENRTPYRGIEAVFTEKLIEAVNRRGLARVVPPAEAEAILTGRVVSISDATASYRPTGPDTYAPADYRIMVVAEIRVTRRSDQKLLWALTSIQEEAYYDARAEPLRQGSARQDALARTAEAIARQVVDRWGGGF